MGLKELITYLGYVGIVVGVVGIILGVLKIAGILND